MQTGNGSDVKMVPAVCTQCGASLEVDPREEAAVCSYCGTPFIVQKAIQQYTVAHASIEHADVHVVKKGAVESVLDFADRQIRRSDEKKQEEERKKREEEERKKEEARQRRGKVAGWFKKHWKVWAGIFGVYFLLVMIGAVTGTSSASRRTEKPSSASEAEETSQAEEAPAVSLITHEYAGFSYQVPETWKEETAETKRSYGIGNDGLMEIAWGENTSADLTLPEVRDKMLENFLSSREGGTLLSSGTVSIDGNDSLRFSYSFVNKAGNPVISDMAFFSTAGRWIGISMTRLEKGTDYTEDFEQVLSSIRIHEPWEAAAAEEAQASQEETAAAEGDSGGVTPSFKETMDSYEAFMDEYVDFLKTYSETDDTTALLTEYLEYMTRYTEVMGKLDDIDESKLSEADSLYYSEVMLRISQKMLEAEKYL